MLNDKLTKEEAVWLVEVFAPKRGGRIDGKTMDTYFLPARKLMLGTEVERPSCGCMFKSYAQMTNSLYGQHEAAIREIAYPKPKTRGRKKV